jgi:phosphoribosylanthranilate isomerase
MIVKICGVRTIDDAVAAVDAGAGMIGINFYAPSPRYVAPASAALLSRAIRQANPDVVRVGVFVNPDPHTARDIIELCDLDLAQLSGDEDLESMAVLNGRWFKAVRVAASKEARLAAQRYARTAPPAFLLDAAAAGKFGGTGRLADWTIAAGLATQYPLLLAGGLTPDNVASAVALVRPWGVDAASGVESAPGVKDATRMQAFVEAARDATSS